MDLSEIPAQFQWLAGLGIAVGIGSAAFLIYVRNAGNSSDASPEQIRLAIGDTQSFDRLRDELREIRAAAVEAARVNARSNESLSAISESLAEIPQAIREIRLIRRR